MASKYHKNKNAGVKLVQRPKSLKCKLGFHFPYNTTGWPMVFMLKAKCLNCNSELEHRDYRVAARISRLILYILRKDHWHKMVRTELLDGDLEILECEVRGCNHTTSNLLRGG